MAVQHEQREQHYSLRWNNHQSHVLNAFDSLLQNEALVDCTLVCEDTSIRAHKVVLSACSPYFQKIFTDNPCKHPIIVLKDVRGWEVQCIVDFMYKGETSVPEAQLNSLIKAAEGLKVRGLTSSDHLPPGLTNHSRHSSRHNSPMPAGAAAAAQAGGSAPPYAGRSVHYSPSPARYPPSDEPHAKVPHLSTTDQSSPMSLTTHDPDARRSAEDRCSAASSASARASPGPAGSGPRRKQARPRRRSGDSIGNASLDLSKAESPTFRKSPSHLDDATPENLSMKRPSSSPAINLVKTETLMEDGRQGLSDNISEASSTADRERAIAAAAAAAAAAVSTPSDDHKSTTPSSSDHFLSAFHSNGLQQHEHEARVEALQALNYMARGMGLNTLPHPHAHPLAGHPGVNGAPHLAPHHMLSSSTASGVIGRPTSTPSTGTSAFNADTGTPQRSAKGQHSAPRGGPPRSWTNDELTKALKNVWNRRMTTSQASRVYGIPYNSLLMYVRGKYGKSLKLDKLKETTPAANDNLNTIGNSRSTPKEKLALATSNLDSPNVTGGPGGGGGPQQLHKKSKHGSGSSSGSGKSTNSSQKMPSLEADFENNPFMAAMTGIASLSPLGGANAPNTDNSCRMKDVMQQIQARQAMLDQSERLKEFEKHMGPEQAKLLMPFFTNAPNAGGLIHPESEASKENNKDQDNLHDKERQVQDILLEATRKSSSNAEEAMEEDDNRNNLNNDVMKPLEQALNNAGGEISAN